MSGATYIHGTHAEEQHRLTLMNRAINETALRQMALRGDERILDVGSGLAQLTRAMARAVPDGRVIGVERDEAQRAEALRQAEAAGEGDLVELRAGDATALPLSADERGSFDVVHTRFLLEHVPRPGEVVTEMVRAARPGGRIILEDDDHDIMRIWPEAPALDRLWRAYAATYAGLGLDGIVGRRLITLLHDAGATPVANTWLFYGACAGHDLFRPLVDNLVGVLEGARASVLAHSDLDDAAVRAGLDESRRWRSRPDAALWYAICWAEGRRDG